VQDTGIGIPQEQLNEIFTPFKQLGQHNHSVEGTGLGLAISQKLVKLMGGELHVRSEIGKGSTFWFELELPAVSEIERCKSDEQRKVIAFKGKKRKILVIDDTRENRSFLLDLLTPLGFDVIEAIDGRDGLAMAFKYQPDLVLLDVVMPVIDGFDVMRQMRQSNELRAIKIIAISASNSVSITKKCYEAGSDDCIVKPLRIQELFQKLKTQLDLEWTYEGNSITSGNCRISEYAAKPK